MARKYNKAIEYRNDESTKASLQISPIVRRIVFHVFSLIIIGGSWSLLVRDSLLSSPSTVAVALKVSSFSITATYLGMLVLFPFKKFAGASRLGLATTLATLFTPAWPLSFLIGGFVTLAVRITKKQFYWGACSIIFFALYDLESSHNLYSYITIPFWYVFFITFILIIGCVPQTLRLIGKELTETFWLGKEANKIPTKITNEPVTEKEEEIIDKDALLDDYADFETSLEQLSRLKEQLSPELVPYIDNIQEKGYLILQNMREDPKDVLPGKRFLNRYLPITHSLIEQLIKAHVSDFEKSQLEIIHQQAKKSLPNLSHAFTQTHQQLLQNDMDNLSADLNVLDKLLKSEGLNKQP